MQKRGNQSLVKCPVVCDSFRKVDAESGDGWLDNLTSFMGPERVRMSAEACNRRGFPGGEGRAAAARQAGSPAGLLSAQCLTGVQVAGRAQGRAKHHLLDPKQG